MFLSGRQLVAAMCVGQVCNLVPHVVVPAVMPAYLVPAWDLSSAEAGLMASAYTFGYMLAVPVLTTLTNRLDARLILLLGSLASAAATVAFGLSPATCSRRRFCGRWPALASPAPTCPG